jgi:2-succinyl-6-hydroxy-2,4-cyclohexadiene-1-carboxylate synthase
MCSSRCSAGSPSALSGRADRLAATARGRGERIVLVHGFTQTGRSWDAIPDRLAGEYEVVAVDAPGHGDSRAVRAALPAAAELLGDVGGAATYAGYSMGGRLCLQLAVTRPELVRRLVLVSATAGIEDAAERARRREGDEDLAASIERDGVDAFLTRWLALPLFATLPPDAAGLADRKRNTTAGLASSLRLAGTGAQDPLWDRLGLLPMPVLLVTGERDAKFVGIAERMSRSIPNATMQVIGGAGHAVHLEQPEAFASALEAWLAALAAESETERSKRAVDEL